MTIPRKCLILLALSPACVLAPRPGPRPTPAPVTTTTTTQPPVPELPTGCAFPQGVPLIGPGPVVATHAPEVAAVMAHLTGCEPGSDCPHGEGPGHDGAQRWMQRVNACLRDPACLSKACRSPALMPERCAPVRGGLCAGFHVDGHTDEISVDCREGYHVANQGGGKVVWPPPWGGAARESWTPEGGCPPAPRPTPTPGPPSSCPLKVDDEHPLSIKVDIRRGGAGAVWLDVTYEYWYGEGPGREPLGPCGRRRCDLGIDGGPDGLICAEELAGAPTFKSLTAGLDLEPGFHGNPYFAGVFGAGRARVCASRRPSVCLELEVP